MSHVKTLKRKSKVLPKPPWLRVRLPKGHDVERVRRLVHSKNLHTVCESALCPNRAECWGRGTATFLILGDTCTRHCRFCAVKSGSPANEEALRKEPLQVAEAVSSMGLHHVVITSVTRDDLKDGGAELFAETVRQVRQYRPSCTIELLIPDFQGDTKALETVMASKPEILGHNMETVSRLYESVRPQADYDRSLQLLATVKAISKRTLTKSGVMVGLGETKDELLKVMADLRKAGCDILTMGQYLRPTTDHLPVLEYYSPEAFTALKEAGCALGFRWIESGPLVRSSYRAELQACLIDPKKATTG